MRRFLRKSSLAALLMLICWCVGALAALTFPALSGRIVDTASVLSDGTKADLLPKLQTLEEKSGIQLVVATVPSLQGQDIAPFANQLFRFWKLGEAKQNNGVLLLIAPAEHRVRIEVGYGLEGTLTDALSSVIITNAIVPRFKANDYNGGAVRGVDDIITVLTTDSSAWQARQPVRRDNQQSLVGALMPFLIMLIVMLVMWRLQRAGGGRGGIVFLPTGGLGGSSFGGSSFGGSDGGMGGFGGGGGSSGGGGASGGW